MRPDAAVLTPRMLATGVAWAFAAGLLWGTAFVAPLLLPGYHAVEIAAGRYAAYGLFSLLMLAVARLRVSGALAGLGEPRVWVTAFGLTLIGNFIYFVAVTAGIQMADAAIAALIIGTLPVLLPMAANLSERTFAFASLMVPSAMMLAGLATVHASTHGLGLTVDKPGYWLGIVFALLALTAWTIYGVANARALKARPDIEAGTWASLQGVTLLPVALPLVVGMVMTAGGRADGRPGLMIFSAVSLILGIATSWLAMWCWNKASARLPAAVVGQLIVFETLAALLYFYLWIWRWPPPLVAIGAALLIAGVVLGLRLITRTSKA